MDNVRVFVLDNDGGIYHISKYRVDEWNRWKYLEDEGILDHTHIPEDAVEIDFLDSFFHSNFEFTVV